MVFRIGQIGAFEAGEIITVRTPEDAIQAGRPNRAWERALALAASSSRFLGGAVVSSEYRRRRETIVTSSTAASNEASFAFEGFVNPLILRMNCRAAARTSSSVAGGSKLNRILIFRHIRSILIRRFRRSVSRRTTTPANLILRSISTDRSGREFSIVG